MSWKHWTAVLVVIGGGILLQIPRDNTSVANHEPAVDGPAITEPKTPDELGEPYRTVSLEVAGMTCATCPTAARMAVRRVEGVKDATFAYPEGTGTVTYDTTMTSPPAFIAELARATGFLATPRGR